MSVRFVGLVVFLIAIISPAALAQTYQDHQTAPDGVRGERIAAVIDALNRNSRDAVEHVVANHFSDSVQSTMPLDAHLTAFSSTYRLTTGVDFYSVRTYTPPRNETVVIVKDRLYGGWHSLVLEFSGDDERISGIRFTPARPPAEPAGATLSRSELIAAVTEAVSRGCTHGAFSGAALVAFGNEVLFESACGEASKRFGVPNDIDTKFNLGSMNKMFTAVAIMQLVEQGRLELDDRLSEYVDESWLPNDVSRRVSIHHLLTHTSGLGSYFNETFMNSARTRYRDLEDYKPLIRDDTLAFEPGERFRYSNTGMFLLGVVIETVTDTSYFDYIRSHVYEPSGMTDSDSYSMDQPVPNLAISYVPAPESEYGWRNTIFEHVIKGGPAGGGFSTVRDLHRFSQALLEGRLLSQESMEKMWANHSDAPYGYGFQLAHDEGAGKVIGHGGGFPGINGKLDIFVDSGYVVAVLANHDRAASPLADHIRGMIARLGPM